MGRRGTRAIEDNYRLKSQEHRFWELKGRIVHCGECGRRMVGHSVFFTRPGQRQHFHYVCTKEGREHAKRCPNKGHRAELLEDRVAEAVTDFMGAPDQLEKIEERRSDASGKPPAIPGRIPLLSKRGAAATSHAPQLPGQAGSRPHDPWRAGR